MSNTYRLDIKVTGFSEIVVKADSYEEAKDQAVAKLFAMQVSDLRWKTTEVDSEENT
jgi:hypothetical protein